MSYGLAFLSLVENHQPLIKLGRTGAATNQAMGHPFEAPAPPALVYPASVLDHLKVSTERSTRQSALDIAETKSWRKCEPGGCLYLDLKPWRDQQAGRDTSSGKMVVSDNAIVTATTCFGPEAR